ncbi:DUF481 domain-containing protein [Lysobacter sp. GX 14042]|uniref:DUF481 domain-containing protein n=1 Tax=Lysobacter sp. GX 14042 TaxID=2907155 RepID=UPI001F310E9A|nr:DUF481 domain-containing protein [Lysobacter sp. GX 14042]MCE7032076.1 DUF481 domain-containing protein [Lysobacter sp. GX 14042]
MRLPFLTLAAAAGLATPFAAVANPATEGRGWHGEGELGLALASGNTDSQTLNGKLGLTREDPLWEHAMGLSLLYGKQDGIESASRYEAFGKLGRRMDDRRQWSGSVRTERDHFAAYEYQSAIAIGYSHELVKQEATQLRFEIGPGYRWSKLQGVRVHENGAIARGQLEFSHQFNPSTLAYDTLLVEAGQENTFARNDVGVAVRMSDALALKAGLQVRHNTDALPGTRKTDTLTTVNVVYGF